MGDTAANEVHQPGVKKWLKRGSVFVGIVAGLVLLGLIVYSLWTTALVLFGIPRPDFMLGVGPADGKGTGEIGDTLGGLLAPIFTAAALVATVIFSYQQITKSEKEAEKSRAEKVVGWVAETDGDDRTAFWRGVLIVNDSGSPVFKVDILVKDYRRGMSEDDRDVSRDREAIVPPGTWFIPFQQGIHADIDKQTELSWMKPVPVDVGAGMAVRLAIPDHFTGDYEDAEKGKVHSYELTAHTPMKEISERSEGTLPYYRIHAMRYTLHGERWWRDQGANVKKWRVGSDHTGDQYEDSGETLSGAARSFNWGTSDHLQDLEITPRLTAGRSELPLGDVVVPVANFLTMVLAGIASNAEGDVLRDAYRNKLPAKNGLLHNVEFVELYGTKKGAGRSVIHSKTISLELVGGGTLRMSIYLPNNLNSDESAKSASKFPYNALLFDPEGEDTKAQAQINHSGIERLYQVVNSDEPPEKSIKGPSVGLYINTLLHRSEEYWANHKSELFTVLQAMVDESIAVLSLRKSESDTKVSASDSSTASEIAQPITDSKVKFDA